MTLQTFFEENPNVAVAFSGGTDSAFVLYAAKAYGARVKAYYGKSPFQPSFEYEDALALAAQLQIPLEVVHFDALSCPEVTANDPLRCYYCKKGMLCAIVAAAKKDGFPLVIDGTNASDHMADRPGMQALQELQVRSPLRECGIEKEQVRALSQAADLFTWDKPAYACLATRIPTGTAITQHLLNITERSEALLRELGFTDFRVRWVNGMAKLQLKKDQLPLLFQHRETIVKALKEDYSAVLLDLEVRQ